MGAAGGRPEVRAPIRSVALPSEHGGWGLTLEPCLLGLLIRPSVPGLLLGLATFTAFLWRTPAKLLVVDLRRHRMLHRTRLAAALTIVEGVLIAGLVVAAIATANPSFAWWAPLLAAVPFVAIEANYEVRSRGRRLVPELAGAVAVSAITPAIVGLGGGSARVGVAAGLLIVARAVASIPWVRDQVMALHGRSTDEARRYRAAQWALVIAVAAVTISPAAWLGAVWVAAIIALQRSWQRSFATVDPPITAKVIGMRQMGLGLMVVATTALSVALFG